MKVLDCRRGPEPALAGLCSALHRIPAPVMKRAEQIFDRVIAEGDRALFRFTLELEKHRLSAKTVKVSKTEMAAAMNSVSKPDFAVLKLATKRITAYHRKQAARGFRFQDGRGAVIEERVLPLARVGLCIPGGRAALASTVLMTAIPARLAGVADIVMITPCPGGKLPALTLAAAQVAGVNAIYKVGGVQGVAALAAGTGSIPRVDKIVGPGSIWVTAAKTIAVSRGLCGIDAVAGPSEIVVAADSSARPEWVAADLLSQAEHGADSIAILVTTSDTLAAAVNADLTRLNRERSPNPLPAAALASMRAVLVRDLAQMAEVVNRLAPEHLEIMVAAPQNFVKKITNAASIFLGPFAPVPVGDYLAGANHVLPTAGAARWSSPLSVYDFVKRQSVTALSAAALHALGKPAARFAELEGLPAHAQAVLKRLPP